MSQKKEFLRKISKKARQELKLYGIDALNDIKLFDTKNQAFIVAQELLKFFYPKQDILISEDEDALWPYSLEEINSMFLDSFLNNSKFDLSKKYFLTGIKQEDLEKYAEFFNLEKVSLKLETESNKFIQELTKEQEQTPMALHNSFDHLRKVIGFKKEN